MAALVGHPLQPGHPRVLPAPARRRQAAKVALTACMRKLLTILNAMVRSDPHWQQAPTVV